MHHAIEPVSDADMVGHLMEVKGIASEQLRKRSGIPSTTISGILEARKRFTLALIRKLAAYFRIHPGVLAGNA